MNTRMIIIIFFMTCFSGCATVQKSLEGQRQRFVQQEKLAQAVKLIEGGNTEKAASILAEIVAKPGLPGVTDEALFRLGLLSVPSDLEQEEISIAVKYLERLQKEYPVSSWSIQAASITDFLASVPRRLQTTTELRRQIRSLKDLNLSLSRENKEIRLNIEKLKTLDLELEKKAKP